MHGQIKVCAPEYFLKEGVADNSILDVELNEQDEDEPPVVEEPAKDVPLVPKPIVMFVRPANYAAVQHVEDIHQHESVE